MAELGGDEDSHSDETIVEGSVMDSDVDEEELQRRLWLPILDTDMALTAQVRINGGSCSAEMYFICEFHEPPCSQKEEQVNLIHQEACTSDQSQSLLQGWINCPSATENISKPDFSLNAAVEEQQNNSVGIELNGVQKDSEEKPVDNQQREKEVISDYCGVTSGEEQTGERSSHPVEAAACAETAQIASRNATPLRETPLKCRDVSSHHQISEDTQQGTSHSDKAKNFEKIQKSKDKNDLEISICQEMTLNEDGKETTERRRSKRIENKQNQEAFRRNFVNTVFPISLSTINRRNMYGETILHRAVAQQNTDFVRNIIKSGGNVNTRDYAGWTALHTASVEGFYEIANELLKAGADVNAKGNEQITPLQDAVKEGHYEVVELLLWYGADPLLKNEVGRCALEEASDLCMRKLLESYVATRRRHSISGGNDSKNMLNAQSVNDTNLHQIVENVQKQNSQKTDEGVFAGVSGMECTEKNGVRNAETNVFSQFTETEVQTKKAGLDLQKTSQQAASYSSGSENKLSCEQAQFNQPSEQQTSKKSDSFQSTRKEAVIVHGTYNTRYGKKMTRKRNANGETQLHVAARRGDLPLVKALISCGICVNDQDYAGWTAIHEACRRGFTEVISELLKAGADVNSRSLDGILPIHDAVHGNYLEVVKILLQHGANPYEKDDSGKSALDQACNDQMKELLKSYSSMDSAVPVETTEITGI